ncbi:acyl-CoA thioesterase [Mucilaginibacter sp. HMF5004]|uniref:acyl-CoA thioesterase n=1 Tax=Mucilaginibacter rivuli TaxID=2857527 RepID=UPI001C60118F|nr:thioesterase family protein [Mucilaginibacter rivuli]MBW4891341.1 acyl-CoA thioesterase [Mucilaginibacter rivuli]
MTPNLANFKYKTPIHIRFSDMDAFGHVNNAIYLTYFEIARGDYWTNIIEWDWDEMGIILGRSEIDYRKPITLNDTIVCYVRTSRVGNSSFDVEYILSKVVDDKEDICTTGKTVCISYDYKSNKSMPIPDKQRKKMIAYDEPRLIMNS